MILCERLCACSWVKCCNVIFSTSKRKGRLLLELIFWEKWMNGHSSVSVQLLIWLVFQVNFVGLQPNYHFTKYMCKNTNCGFYFKDSASKKKTKQFLYCKAATVCHSQILAETNPCLILCYEGKIHKITMISVLKCEKWGNKNDFPL